MRLRLGTRDAGRFGVSTVEFDPGELSFGELEDLQSVGVLGTDAADEWEQLLRGQVQRDDEGKPVLDDEGKPARAVSLRTWRAVTWLALRRAGLLDADASSWPAMRDVQAAVGVELETPAADPKEPEPSTPSGV